MKASRLLVASLEASGVTHIFGLPGEENLALLDAIRDSSIKFIVTRDEQTAVFMAATVGRLTGRVGVALSTLGPGATNLVTGVAYAQLGAMPVLVITGQKPIKKSKQGKFQVLDVVGMMKPITKMSETIVSADRITSDIYQAVRTAENERPGAVHLEFPEDIAEEESSNQPIPWKKIRRAVSDEKAIKTVIEAVEQAKRPIIAIAAGANRKLIRKQLNNFIKATGIPFVTTQMGKGVIDESSDLYIGTTALSDGDFVQQALKDADLVIMVGHDITEKPPVLGHPNIAHLNFYPADIDDLYKPTVEVVGDISYALWVMSEKIKPQKHWDFSCFTKLRKELMADLQKKINDPGFPIKPQRFVYELRQIMPDDGILSLDNGMYKIWIARAFTAHQQNTVLLDNALAAMGAGLPAGMAVKLINPDKKVVVVAGDGGFMMNLADLETAKRLGLDLTVIVISDGGYGMIRWKQEDMKLPNFGLSFTNPDFVKLAASFGAVGHRIKKAEDFKPTLKKALHGKGIHIIDLPIDYSENIRVFGSEAKERE